MILYTPYLTINSPSRLITQYTRSIQMAGSDQLGHLRTASFSRYLQHGESQTLQPSSIKPQQSAHASRALPPPRRNEHVTYSDDPILPFGCGTSLCLPGVQIASEQEREGRADEATDSDVLCVSATRSPQTTTNSYFTELAAIAGHHRTRDQEYDD